MSTVISGGALQEAVQTGTFIKEGSIECAEGVKYDFRMGSRILKASFKRPIDMAQMSEIEQSSVTVEPGEVVFVLSHESINLPNDVMAVLSPKRKLSHEGIMVLGGLCIDPLYKGKLLVGLYNFSSTAFALIPGKKLIAAVFYRLSGDELGHFDAPETVVRDFPEDIVKLISMYKPVGMQAIQDLMHDLRQEIDSLRIEITTDKEWKTEFKNSLSQHNDQIGKLLKSLEDEQDNRKADDKVLKEKLDIVGQKVETNIIQVVAHVKLFAYVASLILGGIITYYGPKLIKIFTTG